MNSTSEEDVIFFNEIQKNKFDYNFMESLINNPYFLNFKFDGENYHWSNGHLSVTFLYIDNETFLKFKNLIERYYFRFNNFKLEFEILNKKILYTQYNIKEYGFASTEIYKLFIRYYKDYIDTDIILDKINELGINSLTENDKSILEDKEVNYNWDWV